MASMPVSGLGRSYRERRKAPAAGLMAVPSTGAQDCAADPMESAQNCAPGRVVAGVQLELDGLGGVALVRPGLCAVALQLAGLLDNQLAYPQWPAAAGRLAAILGELHKRSAPRKGRLVAVRSKSQMTDDPEGSPKRTIGLPSL